MTINVYRKRSFDETDSNNENEKELGTSSKDDEFSKKEQSDSGEISNNDEDEKEQLTIEI